MNFTTSLVVALVTTTKEYESGQVKKCLDQYFRTKGSVDKKIDLHIFFNKPIECNDLLEYELCENINEVKIIHHNFNELDDLYAKNPQELLKLKLPKLPKLGGSAGANNLFFDSMIPLCESNYDQCLMIETDSKPIKENWIDKIIEYSENNKFLIGGSLYKGNQTLYTFGSWTGHINGVAIYKLNVAQKALLSNSKKLIETEVALNGAQFISFDCAIHQYTCTLDGTRFFRRRNAQDYHVIDTPIISNLSLDHDKSIPEEEILKKYPQTIILHQK